MTPTEALWDWRRQVGELYAAARRAAPEAGWRLWRAGRDALYARHAQTPLEHPECHRVLPFFDYDPAWRFEADLVPAGGDALLLPAGADGDVAARPFARTSGLQGAMGRELTLYWLEGYGGGVFLPFADAGTETYRGGRYLLDTIKGADLGTTADGLAVLDFNFAYNPSCAYSPRYVCPLSPAANRLDVAVQAGEKRPDLDQGENDAL